MLLSSCLSRLMRGIVPQNNICRAFENHSRDVSKDAKTLFTQELRLIGQSDFDFAAAVE